MRSVNPAQYATMVASADSRETSPAAPRAPSLARALRSAGFGIVIGLCIALLRRQNVATTLIYSVCIALACWFCIDMGRHLVAGRIKSTSTAGRGWPGWRWMIAVVAVGSILGFIGGTELADLFTGQRTRWIALTRDPREAVTTLLFVVAPAVVITYFFYSRGLIADREAAAQTAQRQAAESRLRLLQAQLEPHMFFNTLANLHVLIGLDPPRAQAMLDQLISFLRATLSGSQAVVQPLEAEFARTRDYLALMQVRMQERLRVRFDLPAGLAQIPVPPLLLQPLVENSIKHGLEPSVTGGCIEIGAACSGASLVLTIRDTGVGLNGATGGEGTNFGLRQVRERLATHYGGAASLSLDPVGDEQGGTLAVIRLPLPPGRWTPDEVSFT
ncbi:MAG: sensor histidine kinase [Steroidobacteraceae bacterium]